MTRGSRFDAVSGAVRFLGGGGWHLGREVDFGQGWEHMLHELVHYFVASGRLPRRRRWRREEFSHAASAAIDRAFASPRRQDGHEITVLAMELLLAGRLGLHVDRGRLAKFAEQALPCWTESDILRGVEGKLARFRYERALSTLERYVRSFDVTGGRSSRRPRSSACCRRRPRR